MKTLCTCLAQLITEIDYLFIFCTLGLKYLFGRYYFFRNSKSANQCNNRRQLQDINCLLIFTFSKKKKKNSIFSSLTPMSVWDRGTIIDVSQYILVKFIF